MDRPRSRSSPSPSPISCPYTCLKAWLALQLPEQPGRWAERHRWEKQTVLTMEFKTFVNAFLRLPCQIIRTSHRLVYRLLSWNPWQPIFFRMLDVLRC